ncbi:MAG: sulfite exporter TauE/SafE family protein [Pseudomonadota bacterium]|nr:sulfite exporter TauE/SafE family protein [Pseudomonadota bacterium]
MTEASLFFLAGLVAGLINALAGGAGFLAFPALLAAGLPPIIANASNFVALLPANLVGFAANLEELAEAHHSLAVRAVMAILGGTVGALILISAGSEAFEQAVPWLLLVATALYAVGPRAKAWLLGRYGFDGTRFPLLLYVFEFLICVYGGFFGLGMGIVMLAFYGLLGQEDLNVANAIKNFVVTIVTLVGIVLFWWQDLIAWLPATVMATGAAIGGFISAKVGHLAPRHMLRNGILLWAVVLTGYAFWRG